MNFHLIRDDLSSKSVPFYDVTKTGATQYHAQLGLPDKGRAIKGLVVCNSWDLEL